MKLLIWDLDNTILDGTFLYDGDTIKLKKGMKEILEEIDNRGFLQSIASKNTEEVLNILEKENVKDIFIFPNISWKRKDVMVSEILKNTKILPKDVAFIDDEEFNLSIVKKNFPEILCINAKDVNKILDMEEFDRMKKDRDEDRKNFFKDEELRLKLLGDERKKCLDDLDIYLPVKYAEEDDEILEVHELMNRANRMNVNASKFDSYDEFKKYIKNKKVIIGSPVDVFGSYGLTLVAIVESGIKFLIIHDFIISCRLLDRNLLSTFIMIIQERFKHVPIKIRFRSTEYNSVVLEQLKEVGFVDYDDDFKILYKSVVPEIEVRTSIEI